MIIPIHGLKYYEFKQPLIGEQVLLIKEKDNLFDPKAIAAYNSLNQQLGYIGARSSYNKRVYNKMLNESINGKIWSVSKNQILVEIDLNN